jgi:hypothetical protein
VGVAAKGLAVMRPDRVTVVAFVAFVVIAGAVSVAIRLGSFELPAFWAAALRYGMAVAIFAALAFALHIPFPRGANLLGALLFSLTFVISTTLLYVGICGSSASMGAIAFAVTPLVTLAMAATSPDSALFWSHPTGRSLIDDAGSASCARCSCDRDTVGSTSRTLVRRPRGSGWRDRWRGPVPGEQA